MKSLSRNQLVLPPLMWSACDLANFHFQGIPNAEPLEFAKGLLSEAQSFKTYGRETEELTNPLLLG